MNFGLQMMMAKRTPLQAAMARYFTDLDPIFSPHYAIPAATLAGDYKVEKNFYFTGALSAMFGDSGTFNSRVRILANGGVDWRPEDSSSVVTTASGVVPLNTMSTIVVERVGSNGTITVNGLEVFSGPIATGQCNINQLAATNTAGTYCDGIISNVKITDAGTLVRHYKIDENFALTDVLANSATTLGSELVVNGELGSGTEDWVAVNGAVLSAVNGRLRITAGNSASYPRADQNITVEVGKQYWVKCSLYDGSATARADVDTPTDGNNNLADGWELITAITSTLTLQLFSLSTTEGSYAEFNSISIREAPGYGKAVNIAESEKYTLVDDGVNWLGEELVTSLSTDAGSSIADGVVTLVQDVGNDYVQIGSVVNHVEAYIFVSYTITEESLSLSDKLSFYQGSVACVIEGAGEFLSTAVGSHSYSLQTFATGALRLKLRDVNAGDYVKIADISARPIINIAS